MYPFLFYSTATGTGRETEDSNGQAEFDQETTFINIQALEEAYAHLDVNDESLNATDVPGVTPDDTGLGIPRNGAGNFLCAALAGKGAGVDVEM